MRSEAMFIAGKEFHVKVKLKNRDNIRVSLGKKSINIDNSDDQYNKLPIKKEFIRFGLL